MTSSTALKTVVASTIATALTGGTIRIKDSGGVVLVTTPTMTWTASGATVTSSDPSGATIATTGVAATAEILDASNVVQYTTDVIALPPRTGATTSGNATITGISSTADLLVGDGVAGTGIPAGATISSLTSNTITISANATATGSGVSLVFTRAERLVVPSTTFTSGISFDQSPFAITAN